MRVGFEGSFLREALVEGFPQDGRDASHGCWEDITRPLESRQAVGMSEHHGRVEDLPDLLNGRVPDHDSHVPTDQQVGVVGRWVVEPLEIDVVCSNG